MLKQLWQQSEDLAGFVKYVKKEAQHPHAALNSRANLSSYTSEALTISPSTVKRARAQLALVETGTRTVAGRPASPVESHASATSFSKSNYFILAQF